MFTVEPKNEVDKRVEILEIYGVAYNQTMILADLEFEGKATSQEFEETQKNIELCNYAINRYITSLNEEDIKINSNYIKLLWPGFDFSDYYLPVIYNKQLITCFRRFDNDLSIFNSIDFYKHRINPNQPALFSLPEYLVFKDVDRDTLNNFIFFLNQEIAKSDGETKKRLINAKYNIIFINDIYNKDNTLYFPKTLKKRYEDKIKLYQIKNPLDIISSVNTSRINFALDELREIDREELNETEKKAIKILLKCLLKSCLYEYSLSSYDYIKHNIKDYLNHTGINNQLKSEFLDLFSEVRQLTIKHEKEKIKK